MPYAITWVNGVTQSLRLQRLQKDIAESVQLGTLADYPAIRHGLIVGTDLDQTSHEFVMERFDGNENYSGWFVGRLDTSLDYNQPQSLTHMSVYEFLLGWPQLGGFLGLPTSSYLELKPQTLRIQHLGNLLEVAPGSFLDRKGF